MPRADTCEMTRFHASKRSKNAVCIPYPPVVRLVAQGKVPQISALEILQQTAL
jgi:hypothetical protein